MSHAVELVDLKDTARPYGGTPFLLYSAADGSARVNHVAAEIETTRDGAIVICTGFGRGVAARIEAEVTLSLLWAAMAEEQFSLIADGRGTVVDETLTIEISSAVLHRPAPIGDARPKC